MLIYPEKKSGLVYTAGNSLFGYNGWPSVTGDENGKLYAVFSGHRLYHVCPFGQSYLCTSEDEGKTWSIPSVINDTPLDDRDCGILYLGNGKLLMTWFVHPAQVYIDGYLKHVRGDENPDHAVLKAGLSYMAEFCGQKELYGSFIRISDDYGKTWGKTIKIPVSSPHGPTVLQDGSLLYVGRDMYAEGLEPNVVAAYRSTDGGETWSYLSTLCSALRETGEFKGFEEFHEPYALQMEDGTILVAIRQEHPEPNTPFTLVTCTSKDGGLTWSELNYTNLVGAPPHLLKHSSGALICSVGRRSEPFGERAYVSYDNGETWADEYVLRDDAPNGDLGYPCSVELKDGRILTVYYQLTDGKNGEKPSVFYTTWKLKN